MNEKAQNGGGLIDENEYYFDYGVSGYGVAIVLEANDLMDEPAIKSIGEEMMGLIVSNCLEYGARALAHIKADFRSESGTIRAHTIGPAHGIYAVGHIKYPVTSIRVVISSMVQGIEEDEVREATLGGIYDVAAAHLLKVNKEREHTYFNPAQSPGEGALLLDKKLQVVEANNRACLLFRMTAAELTGLDLWTLLDSGSQDALYRAVKSLYRDYKWSGELRGRRKDHSLFPIEAKINWVEIDEDSFIQVIMNDVTEKKSLEDSLRREKRKMRELNITLRNILMNIENEKKQLENDIARKIGTLILPALEKAKKETSPPLRNAYLDIIANQLTAMTKGGAHEYEARFFRLTRTEMLVCQLIQSGYTSKEIANVLNLAFDTVQTHRKNIRRKLGLRGRGMSLFSFLSAR